MWADFDCLGEICDRAVVAALGFEDATAVEVGIGVPRIDLDRLGIVRDSAVGFAFSPVDGATVVVSAGVPGLISIALL